MRSFLSRQFSSRIGTGLVVGLICAVAVQSLVSLGWLRGLETGAFDALFRWRGPVFGAPNIALVVANDEDVAKLGSWPFSRSVYARLVTKLKGGGAKATAFDLLFTTPSTDPREDKNFARACANAGNVVQSCAFHVEGVYNPPLPPGELGLEGTLSPRFALNASPRGAELPLASAVWLSAALPQLQKSAVAVGHLNVHPETDGVLRRIPNIIEHRGQYYPSLALATALFAQDLKPQDARIEAHDIRFGKHRVPIGPRGETWINWVGGSGSFPTYSFGQVLSDTLPPETFRNKIVLVGTAASGTFEYRSTPFSPAQPAIELQANALDNILRDRQIRVAGDWYRFVFLLSFALIAGTLIAARLDVGGMFILLILGATLWLFSLWLLATRNYLLPISSSLLAGFLAYSLSMAINYRHEWELNWRTEAAVSTLARGGALMMSGRDRKRLLNVIRSTAREALGASEVHLLFDKERSEQPDLNELAATVIERGDGVLWPFPQHSTERARKFSPDKTLAKRCAQLVRTNTENSPKRSWRKIVSKAEQLPPSRIGRQQPWQIRHATLMAMPVSVASTTVGEKIAPRTRREGRAVLVAIGHVEGRAFSVRDAVLFETLAEQASLALESQEYSELLEGRVELANRDLREAYEILSQQNAKFLAAVENIDDALIICDSAGRAVFVSAMAQPTLGEAAPALGEPVPEVLRRHGLTPIGDLFDLATTTHTQAKCEVEFEQHFDSQGPKQTRVLEAQLTTLLHEAAGQEPTLDGWMLLARDVTAQRELDRMKSDFVSFVAHELRSPLGSIIGYAELLHQVAPAEKSTTENEMTSAIVRQCHHLNRLISDLLDLSRLDAGRALDLRKTTFDMATVCERVLESQRATLVNPEMRLELHCETRPLLVWADADRVEQVLVNLLSNAIKYSPDGGLVDVGLEATDAQMTMRISDQGMGMEPEQVVHIFQKFYRTADAKVSGIKGTGLGLFLVQQLVQAHSGHISVESTLEKGTAFTVTLPRHGEAGISKDIDPQLVNFKP